MSTGHQSAERVRKSDNAEQGRHSESHSGASDIARQCWSPDSKAEFNNTAAAEKERYAASQQRHVAAGILPSCSIGEVKAGTNGTGEALHASTHRSEVPSADIQNSQRKQFADLQKNQNDASRYTDLASSGDKPQLGFGQARQPLTHEETEKFKPALPILESYKNSLTHGNIPPIREADMTKEMSFSRRMQDLFHHDRKTFDELAKLDPKQPGSTNESKIRELFAVQRNPLVDLNQFMENPAPL
jgi:hypothetical protein